MLRLLRDLDRIERAVAWSRCAAGAAGDLKGDGAVAFAVCADAQLEVFRFTWRKRHGAAPIAGAERFTIEADAVAALRHELHAFCFQWQRDALRVFADIEMLRRIAIAHGEIAEQSRGAGEGAAGGVAAFAICFGVSANGDAVTCGVERV